MNRKQKKVLYRIIAASALLLLSLLPQFSDTVQMILFFAAYLTIGYDILIKAFKGVKNRQPFDENFLMAVATVGAIALGDFAEGAAVMLFYQIGELFQSCAVGKSRRSISQLMDIRPDYANLENADGSLRRTDPDEVAVGTVIVVQPGEKIPIDGVVVEGESTLSTGALTGESVPRDVRCGDEVISGCLSLSGLIKVRTTKEFGDSTVSKILELVENASSRKSRSENFISRFARVYTPAVCFAALALAVLPPFVRLLLGLPAGWSDWVYRALSLLVVSCPCALVISIPLSFFAGIGGASSAGVLIKGSNYMETLSKVRHVVFDKTGTLTQGSFSVSKVASRGMPEDKLLQYAALAESFSTHPISRSLCESVGSALDKGRVSDVKEQSGKGVCAKVDGIDVAVGNTQLMSSLGIEADDTDAVGTTVHVAIDGVYAGSISLEDMPKQNSSQAVEKLRSLGVERVSMLTGDTRAVGERVAEKLGIDECFCELLPGDKVELLERFISEKKDGGAVAFAGDGINDAPVLSRADIGIAMGALGSDAAIEAADVVLMDDDPLKIVQAIRISKKCLRIVYENIYFAIGVKLICLLLVALGAAGMWLAIFADVGVMVIAVINAIRALKV